MTDEQPIADTPLNVDAPPPADPPVEVPAPAAEPVPEAPPAKPSKQRLNVAAPPPADPPVEVPAPAEKPVPEVPPAKPSKQRWYVVKVQSGREETIKDAIERRVKIEGLEEFFGQIIIPFERVVEMVKGKRVTKEKKLYPGYLMVEVEFNDRILYLFRETSGVGDFVGSGGGAHHQPVPMTDKEVERMISRQQDTPGKEVKPKPKYDRGDRVIVRDGTFAGMEGEVKELIEAKGLVRVELTIFGRPVPVELEYWQVDHT